MQPVLLRVGQEQASGKKKSPDTRVKMETGERFFGPTSPACDDRSLRA